MAVLSVLFVQVACTRLPVATEPRVSVYPTERFETDSAFARRFPVPAAVVCEAARRALLSQGYVIGTASAERVRGRKYFQPQREAHLQLEITLVCTNERGNAGSSFTFATAIQDRYALKRTAGPSASVGVAPLGSLSLPFGSSEDSLVKVGSETVPAGEFYDRLFHLIEYHLDTEAPPPPHTAPEKAGPGLPRSP
ncbi:MAG: DUF2242 domain-containing protein [Burkholderiaceae bacterium]